jgi:uncharacterized protein
MKNNSVGWFEIYVDDIERAKKFYETMLSVHLEKMSIPEGFESTQMYAFPADMNLPGASGAIVKTDGYEPSPKGTIVHFSCEDCAVEESKVVDAGGEVLQSKVSIGEYGFSSLIKDSEGNVIGLHSMK